MAKATKRQRLRYWFDNTMSKGTPAMVAMLAVITLIVVAVGSVLLYVTDLLDGGVEGDFFDSVWNSVIHALDPGTVTGDDTGQWQILVVAFVITLGGILIFTALIGVLTTGIDAKLAELRKGRSAVIESDHTVLLGWSDQVFAIIPELVEANSNQKRACIAILADRDKVEMEDEIRARLGSTGTTKVVCRSGSPIDPDQIALVNPQEARSVIILPTSEDDHDRDAHLVKMLLAVTRVREGSSTPCQIVGMVTDPANLPAAQLAGGEETHIIDAADVASRLIVQTCLQSGLSVIYTDLLDFGGDEIYFAEESRLVGATYGQALHAYRSSCVVGLQFADGRIALNPHPQTPIQSGDKVIAISEDDDTVVVADAPAPVHQQAIVAYPDPPPNRKRALLLGWNTRAARVLYQLDQYVPPGSEAAVVASHEEASRTLQYLASQLHSLMLNFKQEDSSDRAVLESLDVGSYDHILVLCNDDVDPQLADSRTLVTLLHLRDMEQRAGKHFSIVSEMADDRNRTLAQITQADDFIVSEKMLSLLTTQISENPHLATVFSNLFDADGSEIYLKGAEWYVRLGHPINFQTIVEAARWRGETAIGYRVGKQSHEPPSFGVVLNPDKADPVTFQPGDKVIVLAEN
jgi:Castor and Pollux protein voltage-gated ion channel component